MNRKVGVIGLGYVGLPLACLTASKGIETIGFDLNKKKIELISNGISPIRDKSVSTELDIALKSDNLSLSNSIDDLSECNIYLVCVPTPILENKQPDLSILLNATEMICEVLKTDDILIIESTVFPGTCEDYVEKLIFEKTNMDSRKDYVLSHCPERVNPGDPYWNTSNIPRVIGSTTKEGNLKAAQFYAQILEGEIIEVKDIQKRICRSSLPTHDENNNKKNIPNGSITLMETIRDAEAVKAMENTVRDVNIAFVNELAKISRVLKLDIVDIIDGMETKPFGKGPYYPGIGVGGHCIAVDPEWLKNASNKAGYFPEMINLARHTNNEMAVFAVNIIKDLCQKSGLNHKDLNCLLLGVSYKKNIDDSRESPFYTVEELAKDTFKSISVYDPFFPEISTSNNLETLVNNTDIIILITNHDIFVDFIHSFDFSNTTVKIMFDGRNCIDSNKIAGNIIYSGIGIRN